LPGWGEVAEVPVAAQATGPPAVMPAHQPGWARWLGGLLVAVGSVQAAVLEAFYLPLRVGTLILPVSVLAAVVLNVTLPRLMYLATGSRRAGVVPGALWLLVVLLLSLGRPEGDVIVPGNGLGAALLFLGALAGAFGIGRVLSAAG
jgi:hypothetical protein